MFPRCKICRSKNTHVKQQVDVYQLLRCLNCRIIFVHPQPPAKKVLKHNTNMYDSCRTLATYTNMEEKFFRRAQHSADTVKRWKAVGRLLDVGCSAGYYLKIFRDCGYDIQGIDISPRAAAYAKEQYHVPVRVLSLDKFPGKPERFDIITLFDVIEHLRNPVDSLKKLHSLLKPGGILVLQTPNYDSLMQRITGSRWYWLLIPQHLFLFSPQSLAHVLTDSFEILKLQTWDDMYEFWSNILTIVGLSNTGNYPRLHRRIVRILQTVTTPLSWLWSLFGVGGEMVVYARKITRRG